MKIKVSDLEGKQLAEWAARAQGWVKCNPYGTMTDAWCTSGGEIIFYEQDYRPDINGAQAMELYEKYDFTLYPFEWTDGKVSRYGCEGMNWKTEKKIEMYGKNPRIAITRAAIASVYGETVTVEDE